MDTHLALGVNILKGLNVLCPKRVRMRPAAIGSYVTQLRSADGRERTHQHH